MQQPQLSQKWDFDYLNCPKETLVKKLGSSERGLQDSEAEQKLQQFGYNEPAKKKKRALLVELALKFSNPLVIVLFLIGGVSLFLGQFVSAVIVYLMALISVFLSFIQEHKAGLEAERLKDMVRTTALAFRNGIAREIKIRELVPGDLVDLSAGDMIPADVRILSSKDFFINQSSLTGESFPIEKTASATDGTNIAFMGSSVVSGTAIAMVVHTGNWTSFGALYKKLSLLGVETSFDKGIRQLTMLMVKAMLSMVAFIFAVIAFRHGNFLEAVLFALGVAVGLTPEMLPMIVAVTLSKGALALSKKKVIVKRLNSIQNFGAMDILCTDKTGTLTLDQIVLEKHCTIDGQEDEDVLRYAYLNSAYQTGLKNVLDKAILKHEKLGLTLYEKIDEIPFDFSRRIMSVIVRMDGKNQLISKGAPEEIFSRITKYELHGELHDLTPEVVEMVRREYETLSNEGFRVLAVAYKQVDPNKKIFSKEDEKELILKGYVAFLDPPKPTAKEAILALQKSGIRLKVLTGDNERVTKKICHEVGFRFSDIITGDTIERSSDAEIRKLVEEYDIFARLLPLQKERIVRALHENGHIVGYLGDGINDAPSLKTSDVGISVNNAVDIAKESADIILLKKSLMVLDDGVREGRTTFGNIMKYIKMGTSSNFGNMLSMTGASMLLPFLPMLPIQILLNNFLYDLSQVTIPTDSVDPEYLKKPKHWDVSTIKRFMLIFGPVSSLFDYLTFAVLLFGFQATAPTFHTGWFLESLCTQTLVIHIIRTHKKPFVESWPSRTLFFSSICIVLIGLYLPFSSLAPALGLVRMPPLYFVTLFAITGGYFFLVQKVKEWFIKKFEF